MSLPIETDACPTPEQLAEYSQGLLTEEGSERIESHLASCDTCEATLQIVDAKVGTVVTPKRDLERDPYEEEKELAEAVEAAVRLGRSANSGTILKATGDTAVERELGQYRLLEKLGEGGMGAVYKSLHTKLDRVVALKLLNSAALQDESAVARFEREMRAVGKLQHPNIVGAHDAGDLDGTHYLVMELVEGCNLSELLARDGALPTGTACELARQAALGLQHAHEHGMVHRDIKPSNLMLTGDGVVKILDMGLALLSEHHAPVGGELTGTGVLMGTLDYMAPEQGADTHNVDIRADVYSLGATLYKLLAGRAPFGGEEYTTPIQKLQALAIKEPERLESVRPGLPEGLADIVHRMLAKNPAERFATPAEVVEALRPFADGSLAGLAEDPLTSINEGSGETADEPTVLQGSSARVADVAPTILSGAVDAPTTAHRSDGGRKGPSAWALVGGLAGAAAVLVLAIVFFLPTKNGTIRVEINDPDVKVEVTANGIVVTDGDEDPVTVAPGEHTLKVTRGDFSFTTNAFTVTKGEEVVVRIERLNATIKVSKADGTPLGAGTDDPVVAEGGNPRQAAGARPEYDLTDEQQAFFAATELLPVERKRETVLAKLGWTGDAEAREDVYGFADGDVRAVKLNSNRITDLWPLLVYPNVERVDVTGTRVVDFRVLAQFPLTELEIDLTLYNLKSEEVLRGIHTLARINGTPAAEFWATREKHRQEIAEMREAAKSLQHADVLAWLEKKVDELNPGQHVTWSSNRPTDGANVAAYWKYEGRGSVYLRGCGGVRELGPLRALDFVEIGGQMGGDLHVLAGLPIEVVSFSGTHFHDLAPLEGMELRKFHLNNCGLRDLGSLRGMPLTSVDVSRNPVSDLTPLKGAPLELLNVSGTPVADLSPLEGMSLKHLDCSDTPVSDVSVLAGMPIEGLSLGIGNGHPHDAYRWQRWGPAWQPVRDLSPLKGMPLKSLSFDHVLEDESFDELLKGLPLERINGRTADEFWTDVEKQRAEAAATE